MRAWNVVLTGLFLLGLPAVVQAQFIFTTNNDAITITGYTGTSGDVIIPDTISGYPVTSIGAINSTTSLTNITIPDRVTNIAAEAFSFQSRLTNILVDEQNAYYSSSNGVLFDKQLTLLIQAPGGMAGTYAIPASVVTLGDNAFYDCGSLTNINLGTNVASIGAYTFNYCAGLTDIAIPGSVTNIGNAAFEYCGSLTNVSIGAGVTTIGSEAFAFCSNLTGIAIPSSVTNIVGTGLEIIRFGTPFVNGPIEMVANCSRLTAITVDGQNLFYSSTNGILFNKTQTTLLEAPGAFAGSYVIPDSVISIGAEAFQNCAELTNISIQDNVTNIGNAAFADCGNLTAMTVGGHNPFYSSINGILFDRPQTTLIQFPGGIGGGYTVGSGITSLGSTAFSGCSNLTRITIPSSVTNVGSSSFAGPLNAGIYFAGNAPSITSSGLFSLSPPQLIFGNNFYNPNAEAVYYLPDTTGWNATFDGITAYLWVPPYVCTPTSNSITINGFNGSGGVISIPDLINGLPVTALASGVFDNSAGLGLTNIIIGTNVTTIGSYAFAACTSLATITIPSSVTNIGSYAFTFCDNLQSVYFQGDAPNADSSVFFHWSGFIFPPGYEPPTPTTVYYLPGTTGWGTTFGGQPTVLWNPQAQTSGASIGISANRFGFNITGSSNLVVVVEATTNFSSPDWLPVQTNTLTGGSAYFSDPDWTNYPNRFYRFRSPQ